MGFKSKLRLVQVHRYLTYGVLFGLLFPLASWSFLLGWKFDWSIELLITLHQQHPLLYVIDSAPLFLGWLAAFAGYQKDQLEAERDRFYLAAFKDDLTGLPNRRSFHQQVLQQHAFHQPNSRAIGTLLFIDLDKFKLVNDSFGHHLGDHLLKVIGERLLSQVRATDKVFRLGGDEFLVLLPPVDLSESQAEAQARKVAAHIIKVIAKPVALEGHLVTVDSSVGISLYDTSESWDRIVTRGDNAMYHAKQNRAQSIVFYTDQLHQELIAKTCLLEALDEGIKSDQLRVYYQPQFNSTHQLTGAEALTRWEHPTLGLLTPDQFIPLAEQHFKIATIDGWVIESVFKQIRCWSKLGLLIPKVAINLSPVSLADKGFIALIDRVSGRYGVQPDQVVFELTEQVNLQSYVDAIENVLDQLVVRGYHISIDDFGTEYAAMTTLKRLPISQIKIDRSFIADIESNKESVAITQALLMLADALQVEVVAEGVETQKQMSVVNQLGCNYFQGHLFSEPLLPNELRSLYQDYTPTCQTH